MCNNWYFYECMAMENEIEDVADQIEVKKLLKLKIPYIEGKTNAESLVLTLKPLFPSIKLLPAKNKSSYAIVGDVQFSISSDQITDFVYIRTSIRNIVSKKYSTEITVNNNEIDILQIENEYNKAKAYKAKIDQTKSLNIRLKKELSQKLKENAKILRLNDIQFKYLPLARFKDPQPIDQMVIPLNIKGKFTKDEMIKIAEFLSKLKK
jgi:hypothetical protein